MIIITYISLKTRFEPKQLIYFKFKQYDSDQFKMDIFNSMFAMGTQPFNFLSILDKHAQNMINKKIQNFMRESKTPF